MNSKSILALAENLASVFHYGQLYGDKDYFNFHIKSVVALVRDNYRFENDNISIQSCLIVAYLHDILEDTSCKEETIRNIFGDKITEAVVAINKKPDETRRQYLSRVKQNKIACFVKIQDAVFNKLQCIISNDELRADYYRNTIKYLEE